MTSSSARPIGPTVQFRHVEGGTSSLSGAFSPDSKFVLERLDDGQRPRPDPVDDPGRRKSGLLRAVARLRPADDPAGRTVGERRAGRFAPALLPEDGTIDAGVALPSTVSAATSAASAT